MIKDTKANLAEQGERLFMLMRVHFGDKEARAVWARIAKGTRGTGKAATAQYNRALDVMWQISKTHPEASQGELIREIASMMNRKLGARADASRERQLERKWPAYRKMREKQEMRHRQALAEALVVPVTPIARHMHGLFGLGMVASPPTEKTDN